MPIPKTPPKSKSQPEAETRNLADDLSGNETSLTNEALAIAIVQLLQNRGHRSFLVGGCVRDRLLGLVPKDFDVSTDATPDRIAECLPGSRLVGAHFGVVLVRSKDGAQVEVATFRSEGLYSDGRRPDCVNFETDPALDAGRRDFTINGLMEDPVSGEILDVVGGREDLSAKLIRAIGDPEIRFEEDHLRMLRAVRFAARLNFAIEAGTLAAIRKRAYCILRISAERIRDELVRILTQGGARRGLQMLDDSGLLAYILPEVKAFQGVQQPPEFHPEGDVWTHVLLMLGELNHPAATLAWGVLLHDVGKPATFRVAERIRFDGHAEVGARMAAQILTRLKVSNAEAEQVVEMVANHMRFKDVLNMRLSTLKRFLSLPKFAEHLELHRLDCMASNGYTEAYRYAQQKLDEFSQLELRPPRLIGGEDLIEAGYRPGPRFKPALEAVETAVLESEISTKEQALSLARFILDKMEG